MPGSAFTVTVPLDAGDSAEGPVKVVARAADGTTISTIVDLAANPSTTAELTFDTHPGATSVAVGPVAADDDKLFGANSLSVTVPPRLWVKGEKLSLAPIVIGPWYWGWWRRWCRTITVKGRLQCRDGSPVPGATVTALDVDWWFLWSSSQVVSTATTAADGTFAMTFTWCCGYYPWWWWFQIRPWTLNQHLQDRVQRVLSDAFDLKISAPTSQPSLSVFADIIGEDSGIRRLGDTAASLAQLDPDRLEKIREALLKRLPRSDELERFRVWPWVPFLPWNDCSPDLIFTATQDCGQGPVVILDETIGDTRWDVPNDLEVTLVANDLACCLPTRDPVDCLTVTEACGIPLRHVAGNLAAPAAPAATTGFAITSTDGVDEARDQPFAETVTIEYADSDLVGIDYYALQISPDGVTWQAAPAGAHGAIVRNWIDFTPTVPPAAPAPTVGSVVFTGTPVTVGTEVYSVFETRRHVEDTGFPGEFTPLGQRYWYSGSLNTLVNLQTPALADGTHYFRVVSFSKTGPETWDGPMPVVGCDDHDVVFVLTVDNRVISSLGHNAAHNCGTVHTCTTEPDTAIEGVWLNGTPVAPCDTILQRDGLVVIEFSVTDPDRHLGSFSLSSHWGNNNSVELIGAAGSTLTCLTGGPSANTYADALAGGAVRPEWGGGRYRLELPVHVAFPERCCYLLQLVAVKRTIVSCGSTDHRNHSEMTLGVGV